MGRFYFDVRRADVLYQDNEGLVLFGLAEAWDHALRDAQILVDQVVFDTWDDVWLEIRDGRRRQVATVALIHFTESEPALHS